jgi:hypothetical protein
MAPSLFTQLALLLIWLCAAVAVLKLLDLFLSPAQKTWLSNAVIKAWNVLDEAKAWSFADWLKRPRSIWWLAVSLTLLSICFQLWLERTRETLPADYIPSGPLQMFLNTAFIGIIVLLMARLIFARLLRFTSMTQLSGRLFIILIFVGIVYALLGISIEKLIEENSSVALILMLVFAPVTIALLCVLAVFLSMAMVYLASAILYVGEFVVRRIAEYPKGPVLALSTLLGGVVALIKAFG